MMTSFFGLCEKKKKKKIGLKISDPSFISEDQAQKR
jgi:hypothetical protein